MRQSALPFLTLLGTLILLGCQSNPAKEFEKLRPGMDKGQVLDVMGSPQRTQRWHGLDRWTYIIPEDGDRHAPLDEKEVHFSQGKASYVGGKFTPAISAEEQDVMNETENAQLEKEAAVRREENRQTIQREQTDPNGENEIRYVPEFEPVR